MQRISPAEETQNRKPKNMPKINAYTFMAIYLSVLRREISHRGAALCDRPPDFFQPHLMILKRLAQLPGAGRRHAAPCVSQNIHFINYP
jgi:hypothetical protein